MADFAKTFTDTKGRSWTVQIGWGTFERVKEKTGVDLSLLVPRKGMSELEQRATVEKYLDLIYSSTDFPPVLMTILDSQMAERQVTPEDFKAGFENDESIEAVTNAFKQALQDFTRDPLVKLAMKKTMQGIDRMQTMATQKLDAKADLILTKMEAELAEKMDSVLTSTFIDSPASSASIPQSPGPKA